MSNNSTSTLNMPKSLSFLTTELKTNTQELVKIRSFILSLKSNYKIKITEYNSVLSSILKKEAQIEESNLKLAKVKQKTNLSLYQLSSSVYFFKLKDSAKNPDCFHLFNILFTFCSPTQSNTDFDYSSYLLFIPKNSDFKELLESALDIQSDLYKESPDVFDKIKNAIPKEQVVQYPFDVLFEYFNLIYEIIAYENIIETQEEKHTKENNIKNSIFVEIKRIEREVNLNDCVYRRIDRNVNEINTLLNNYKALNNNSNKSIKNKLYKEFIQSLKDYHPMTERNYINKNYLTTLSINSEANCGNGNANAKMNGDNYTEQRYNGKRAKNSKQNSIYSSNSFKTTSNKQFLSSFAEILPDHPETEINNILKLIKGRKVPDEKTRNTNQCSTIESQRELLDEEDFTGRAIEYDLNDNKQSICEELPTCPTQIFSIRMTTIGSNNNILIDRESMRIQQSISRNRAIL